MHFITHAQFGRPRVVLIDFGVLESSDCRLSVSFFEQQFVYIGSRGWLERSCREQWQKDMRACQSHFQMTTSASGCSGLKFAARPMAGATRPWR